MYPYIYIYVHINILGSSVRFARAEDYGITLWENITVLYYGIILRDIITG